MTEERYQYLNSLSIEEYDKETSAADEVIYYQTHNPD